MKVHPDMIETFHYYRDKGVFGSVFEKRSHLCSIGVPYWNTIWDWLFHLRVSKLIRMFKEPYPGDCHSEKKKKGKA